MLRIKDQAERRLEHGSVPVRITEVEVPEDKSTTDGQSIGAAQTETSPQPQAARDGVAAASEAADQTNPPLGVTRVLVVDDSDDDADDDSLGFCSAHSREIDATAALGQTSVVSAGASDVNASAPDGDLAPAVSFADAANAGVHAESPKESAELRCADSNAPLAVGPPPIAPDAAANALKDAGNQAFIAGQLDRALLLYTQANERCPMLDAPLCNRAAVHLKQEKWLAAVHDCSVALHLHPPTERAFKLYLRRAQAQAKVLARRFAWDDCEVRMLGCEWASEEHRRV